MSDLEHFPITKKNVIKYFDILPFPICIFASNGELIFSNQEGRTISNQLKDDFYIKYLNNINDCKNLPEDEIIKLDDKEFILTTIKINQHNKPYILVILQSFSPFRTLFKSELKKYQSSIEDLQAIFDNSYDVLYVSDGDGKTLRVSSACEILWGKKQEDLIGKTVYELEKEKVYYPSVTRLALEEGRKVKTIQTTKTGKKLMVTSTPIHDIHGNITRVVNASKDITEVNELEEEIKNMKQIIEGYRKQLSKPNTDYNAETKLVYRSKQMQELVSVLSKVSWVDSTVLITGESGVGKEVFANYIHINSNRSDKPFIKINCAALPENLLESELFGYEGGTFTGAQKKGRVGLFELANEGTLFLDEIGDMSLNLQTKLLRVLQDKEIRRVGGHKTVKINVRLVAATNQDLLEQITKGNFREDLFYRLHVIPINILPLRERREDIIPLLHHFIKIKSLAFSQNKTFTTEALNILEKYDWPGNVRELQNIVERLIVTSNTDKITSENIPKYIMNQSIQVEEDTDLFIKENIEVNNIIPLNEAVSIVEEKILGLALNEYPTLSKVAEILNVNQSTISRKLQRYNLEKK